MKSMKDQLSQDNNNSHYAKKYEELDQPEPVFKPDFSSVIIVDGLPTPPPEKQQQLQAVILKVFKASGNIVSHHFGKGFAFIEFENETIAKNALTSTNGKRLDQKHKLKVTRYADFARVEKISDTYTPPKVPEMTIKPDLQSWLLDPRGLDQFALRYADVTEICWNDLKNMKDPESVERRDKWGDMYVTWSPKGTYLALFDNKFQSISVYGGPKFDRLVKLPHPNARYLEFSPCERFIVTGRPSSEENEEKNNEREKSLDICVWDIRSGSSVRTFSWVVEKGKEPFWPVFKWSRDGNYLARAVKEAIYVYDSATMSLVEKPIQVPNLAWGDRGEPFFSMSPVDNYVAFFIKPHDQKPGCVRLVNFTSGSVIAQKNLFNAQQPRMFWQAQGDFLAVKVDTLDRKGAKLVGSALEVFHIREVNIPITQFQLNEERIKFVTWEPKSNRLAMIVSVASSSRPKVMFLSVDKKNNITVQKSLENKQANSLFWSPKGKYIVIAGLAIGESPLGGTLEFYNATDFETMNIKDHIGASSVEWDTSGRYVATVSSFWRNQAETSYNIWSFSGKQLQHVYKEKFCQFLWRPRPPTLLSQKEQQEIIKDEKAYRAIVKKEMNQEREIEREEMRKKKAEMLNHFVEYLKAKKSTLEKLKEEREKIFALPPPEYIESETTIEEIISFKEKVLDE